MNVTFKQVIKRTKRIVYTWILCSTGCKLFRVYAGSKSFKISRVTFSYGSGMSAPSKRVIFHFWMMTPCDGIDCSRVRRSTEFDISSTKVWSLFSYQKVWYFHMSNTDKQNISRDEHRELEPRGCETASRAGKVGFGSPIPDESNQHWPGKFGSRCHSMQNVLNSLTSKSWKCGYLGSGIVNGSVLFDNLV